MIKTTVIAPMGMSPPAITSFIERIGEPVSDIVIISTDNPVVQAGVDLATIALMKKYPYMGIHGEMLPFDDITTQDETFVFMATAARIIRQQRERYGTERIYLNIAGGRKNMCITLSLIGQLMNVDGVFHIIARDIQLMNQQLEYLRYAIDEIHAEPSSDRKLALYAKNEVAFTRLLFPPPAQSELVRIPTLPYPAGHLTSLITALRTDIMRIPLAEQQWLASHGILEQGKSAYYLTEYGVRFVDVLIGKT